MNRTFRAVLAVLFILALAIAAQAAEVKEAKILDYGLVKETAVQEVEPQENGLSKEIVKLEDVQFLERTDTVPAKAGTEFGFMMQLEGEPKGEAVDLVFLLITPGLQTPKGKVYKSEFVENNHIGDKLYIGYNLNKDWELAPGSWTYLVFFEGRKLLERSFTVKAAQ